MSIRDIDNTDLIDVHRILDSEYSVFAISFVYYATAYVPLFVESKAIECNKSNSFAITSEQILKCMRILGFHHYGLLLFHILKKNELNSYFDVNIILQALRLKYLEKEDESDYLWIFSKVEIQSTDKNFFSSDPVLADDAISEIEYCDLLIRDMVKMKKDVVDVLLDELGEVFE